MAESSFDRAAFAGRLTTRGLGRRLIAEPQLTSTNDRAWEMLSAGEPDGLVVVADAQTRGRGRAGRVWHTAPGKGLALSLLLVREPAPRLLGVLPLACGLALYRGLAGLGVASRLRWPNDVLLGGRKVAGILAESRGVSAAGRASGIAVVIGLGVNVSQTERDFPPELRDGRRGLTWQATSLALEGHRLTREEVAAEFLNALEPLWLELVERGPERVIEAWRQSASFWGERVRVRSGAAHVTGVARGLDPEGRLVLDLEGGGRWAAVAGDLDPDHPDPVRGEPEREPEDGDPPPARAEETSRP